MGTRVAPRAVVFQLAVRAPCAVHAVAFHLAVGAGVARRAMVFQLAVRARGALRTKVFQLAVSAAAAHRAVAFHLAVRAGVALRARPCPLAVRTRVAHSTLTFLPPMRAPLSSHLSRSTPSSPHVSARHEVRRAREETLESHDFFVPSKNSARTMLTCPEYPKSYDFVTLHHSQQRGSAPDSTSHFHTMTKTHDTVTHNRVGCHGPFQCKDCGTTSPRNPPGQSSSPTVVVSRKPNISYPS